MARFADTYTHTDASVFVHHLPNGSGFTSVDMGPVTVYLYNKPYHEHFLALNNVPNLTVYASPGKLFSMAAMVLEAMEKGRG